MAVTSRTYHEWSMEQIRLSPRCCQLNLTHRKSFTFISPKTVSGDLQETFVLSTTDGVINPCRAAQRTGHFRKVVRFRARKPGNECFGRIRLGWMIERNSVPRTGFFLRWTTAGASPTFSQSRDRDDQSECCVIKWLSCRLLSCLRLFIRSLAS